MLIRRSLAARPVFAWRTSTRPALVRTRLAFDDARLRRATSIRSTIGDSLTLGYAGLPEGASHVVPFLEERAAGGDAIHRETRTARWAEALAPSGVDLMAIGAPAARLRPLMPANALLLPFRIELVVPVVPDAGAMRARMSRKERQRVARQRRDLGWTLEHATATGDFEWFYEHVHLPTMRERHGPAARSLEREIAFQCVFRRGLLFFLTEGPERIAGMLCLVNRRTRTLTLRLAGVTHGARSHYGTGAFAALYALILEWAATNGIRAVNLSGCEPFLSKGIFQFKRKLHPRVVLPADHFGGKRLLLRVLRDTPRVRDLLVANPVVTETPGGALEAVYFHDEQRPARLDLRWEGTGLRAARLAHLDVFLRDTADRGHHSHRRDDPARGPLAGGAAVLENGRRTGFRARLDPRPHRLARSDRATVVLRDADARRGAQCTRRIRLGTLVASPNFRHPVPFAKEALTLADLADDRFVLGIGAGASGADAAVLGEAPWSPAERRDRFSEFVEVMDQLLRKPCSDYAGRFYSARNAWIDPDGGARDRIPVVIAGSGPTGMRLAARHGDGWVTNGVASRRGLRPPAVTPELAREQIDAVRRICVEEGRDPATLKVLLLNVNREQAPFSSVAAFADAAGRYAEIGVTDLIVPFPRSEPPYEGDLRVLEQVAADVLPMLAGD